MMTHNQYQLRIRWAKAISAGAIIGGLLFVPTLAGIVTADLVNPHLPTATRLLPVLSLIFEVIFVAFSPVWAGILCGLRCPRCKKGLVSKCVKETGRCRFCDCKVLEE
jgi:hypothetical protein